MDEPRAKDVLQELKAHRSPGELVASTVGARAWKRPPWALSPRIFHLYRLPDPWDPASKETVPVGLGPVSLRLGSDRREPAPHAKPKAASSTRKVTSSTRTSTEDAYERFRKNPPRVPKAPPKVSTPPPAPPPQPEVAGAAVRSLKGKLPVRPDLDKPVGDVPTTEPLRAAPAGPKGGTAKTPGRFSMRATEARAPIVRDLTEPEAAPDPEPRSEEELERVERAIPRGASIDDLFGFAGDAPRLKMPKGD